MRTLPESAPALADGRLAKVIWAWPAITSLHRRRIAAIRDVRDVETPAMLLNSSAERCEIVPLPGDVTLSLPGLASA